MLSQVLKVLLDTLQWDSTVYSLHSLKRGGATTVYRAGTDHLHIKCHGMWSSDTFWAYVIVPCIMDSPVVVELTAVTAATF